MFVLVKGLIFLFLIQITSVQEETTKIHFTSGKKLLNIYQKPSRYLLSVNKKQIKTRNKQTTEDIPHLIINDDSEFPLEKDIKILLDNRDAEISPQSKGRKRFVQLINSENESATSAKEKIPYEKLSNHPSENIENAVKYETDLYARKRRNIANKVKFKNSLHKSPIQGYSLASENCKKCKSNHKKHNEKIKSFANKDKRDILPIFKKQPSALNDDIEEKSYRGDDFPEYRPDKHCLPNIEPDKKPVNHEPTVLFDDYAQDEDSDSILGALHNQQSTGFIARLQTVVTSSEITTSKLVKGQTALLNENLSIDKTEVQRPSTLKSAINNSELYSTSTQNITPGLGTVINTTAIPNSEALIVSQRPQNTSSVLTSTVKNESKRETIQISEIQNDMTLKNISTKSMNNSIPGNNTSVKPNLMKMGTTEDKCASLVKSSGNGLLPELHTDKGSTTTQTPKTNKLGELFKKVKNSTFPLKKHNTTTKSSLIVLNLHQEDKTTVSHNVPFIQKIFGAHQKKISTIIPSVTHFQVECSTTRGSKIYPIRHKGGDPGNHYYHGKHSSSTIEHAELSVKEHITTPCKSRPTTCLNKNITRETFKPFIPKRKAGESHIVRASIHNGTRVCDINDIKEILPQHPRLNHQIINNSKTMNLSHVANTNRPLNVTLN